MLKHKLRFQWRSLAVLALALLLVPACSRAVTKPPGDKDQQTADVQVTVLMDLIKPKPDAKAEEKRVVFVSLDKKDPDDAFLQRLSQGGITAKAGSKAQWKEGHVIDPDTGQPSVIFSVNSLKWDSDTQVQADASAVYANLGANGSNYEISWDGDKWKVTKVTPTWIA